MHSEHNPLVSAPLFGNVLISPLSLSSMLLFPMCQFPFVFVTCTIDLVHRKAEPWARTRLEIQGNLNRMEIK